MTGAFGVGKPEYDLVIRRYGGWCRSYSSSTLIEADLSDLWLTLSSDGLDLRNERRLEIRSADRDLSREIFSCISFRRPFILWARAKLGLEVVEDAFEAAVGGRTCKTRKKKDYGSEMGKFLTFFFQVVRNGHAFLKRKIFWKMWVSTLTSGRITGIRGVSLKTLILKLCYDHFVGPKNSFFSFLPWKWGKICVRCCSIFCFRM